MVFVFMLVIYASQNLISMKIPQYDLKARKFFNRTPLTWRTTW